MKLLLSNTAWRGALVALALALLAYLAYFSVRTARATYYSERQTLAGFERATQIEPQNAQTWYLLGRHLQYSFEDGDSRRAISSYLKSLELDPRATLTWLDLAAVYESEGNNAGARDAFANARRTHPASAEVSWRYGNFLLRQGELQPAFTEIRRSVQADPMRAAEAFSRCYRVQPDAKTILDQVLPANRDVYLSVLQDLTGETQIDNALIVWARLAALRPTLELQDVAALVRELRESGRASEAHRVWLQAAEFSGLGNLEGPTGSVVWDGGFESQLVDQGYAWRLPDHSHVQISFDSREKHSGKRSLRISFDGSSNISFHGVCQIVPVQRETAYQLSGWMQPKELTTDQGLRIEMHAVNAGSPVVFTPDVRDTHSWNKIEATWEGSKANQEMEICLQREQSDQDDNKIRGTVWVDDIALIPVSRSGAKR